MFSQTAEYALRAVVFLAESPGDFHTTQRIAETTQIPRSYLAKVMQALARAGVVRAQRGLNGGFALNEPAQEVSVFEVLTAVDPLPRINACPLGLDAHAHKLCPLHTRIDGAMALVEQEFRNTPISELLTASTFQPNGDDPGSAGSGGGRAGDVDADPKPKG